MATLRVVRPNNKVESAGTCLAFKISDSDFSSITGIQGNVAVGKPAMQSSIFPLGVGSYAASQAVDGQRIAVPFGVGSSCACTNNDVHKWWMVDLRATYLVTDVAVLKRNDDILGRSVLFWNI